MARLSREYWLEQGLNTLAESGVDALTIEAMCQLMGVTKGSFYHHFQNRQAFLESILAHWEDKYTKQFIEFSSEGLTTQEKLVRLHERVIEDYGTYEINIRAWAQVDPLAREFQERVDQQRLEFLFELQKDLFDNPEEARTMAHLQYTALIGSTQIIPSLEKEDLDKMYRLLTKISASIQNKDR